MTQAAPSPRARRLRAPLLVGLAALLAFESLGGLVIFFARLAAGRTPGEALHVAAGVALTIVYSIYLWGHWARTAPWRARLDSALGLIAALALALTQATGLWLGWQWGLALGARAFPVAYTPFVSAAHNVTTMFTLTFAGAHLGAVLQRDARARARD